MRYLKTNKLYCFSPPVMIATFFLEIAFAVYVVTKYKMNAITRLATAILVSLAIFQLAEFNVCEGAWGVDSLTWARIGYVAITLLPALGIHLAITIAGQHKPLLVKIAYTTAAFFAFIFLFVGGGMQSEQCLGNYVMFDIASWALLPYSLYYYGWLLVGVAYCINVAQIIKKKHIKKALYALMIGYLSFIIPTTTINVLYPETMAGIPSIMCGFAVILAVLLTGIVVPESQKAVGSGKKRQTKAQ